MIDLPIYARIYDVEYQRFEDEDSADDYRYADLVKCNNCMRYGYVELGSNLCASCGENVCMQDILIGDIEDD